MTAGRILGEGWAGIGAAPEACGVVLAVVAAGGHRWHLATRDVHVKVKDGAFEKKYFRGAITNDPSFSMSVDPFTRDSSVSTVRLEVLEDALPLLELRASGIFIQDVKVDLYWHVEGIGHDLTQAFHLVSGYLVEPVFDDERGTVSFQIEDRGTEGEKPFPPIVATVDRLDPQDLDPEHSGKPYPVIFGTVKKAPLLKLSNDYATWLVMEDRFTELGNTQADQIYDGDVAVNIDTQGHLTDDDGNGYYYIDADTLPTSKDVTADVTGYEPGTISEIVRRLFTNYVEDTSLLEEGVIQRLDTALSQVEVGLVVNERVPNVIDFIRDRIARQFPVSLVQYGPRYDLVPLSWSRDVSCILSTDTNIVRATAPPRETRRSAVYNDFVLKYGRSGLRGDHTGVVQRNPDNDAVCKLSAELYGLRSLPDFDCGDVTNLAGAWFISDWLVETFSKMRVLARYACTLDVAAVRLWDTVRVFDHNQGWSHGPLFKVSSIGYGDGPAVELGLVSLDDYQLVHGAGQ